MNNLIQIFKPTDTPMNIVVFVSGSGTNLKALCDVESSLKHNGMCHWNISAVFTNADSCGGIEIAKSFGKNVVRLSSKKFFEILRTGPDDEETRKYYDTAVISLIEQLTIPDLVVLAGYRRKLSELFYSRFNNRILNMYPGDITKQYLVKGIDASIQAIRNGDKSIKATVYIDQPGTRFGLPLLQSDPIQLNNYTEDDSDLISKHMREKAEWIILPYAVSNLLAKGKISIDINNHIYCENIKIPENGLQLSKLKDNIAS